MISAKTGLVEPVTAGLPRGECYFLYKRKPSSRDRKLSKLSCMRAVKSPAGVAGRSLQLSYSFAFSIGLDGFGLTQSSVFKEKAVKSESEGHSQAHVDGSDERELTSLKLTSNVRIIGAVSVNPDISSQRARSAKHHKKPRALGT